MRGRPCTICQHPKRSEIDLALTGGKSTIRAIADHFQVSRHCLERHTKGAHVHRGLDIEQTLAVLQSLSADLTATIAEARQCQDQRIKRGAIRQAQETAAEVLRCTTL
ncbi:MAG: hypothetical protein WCE46_02550 [Methanoregula sp.]|uniref:hypothetical protein n=1 Tax=Methanoregula sp. TaxID=2052170 RepID=UPI003C70AC31